MKKYTFEEICFFSLGFIAPLSISSAEDFWFKAMCSIIVCIICGYGSLCFWYNSNEGKRYKEELNDNISKK